MNPCIQNLLTRRSIRSFGPDPVPREMLHQIVETAMFAPSSRGSQPWHFTIVTDMELLNRISAANREIMLGSEDERMKGVAESPNFSNFYNAPAAVFVSAPEAKHALADAGNAAVYLCLAAHALGVGSCYIASFRPAFDSERGKLFKSALRLPEGFHPLYAVALGTVMGDAPKAAERREDMVTWIE